MKKEENITIRIDSELKREFQEICEHEKTDMSNKIHFFIGEDVKAKKIILIESQIEELIKLFGYNIHIVNCPDLTQAFRFSKKFTFIDFIEENKYKKIYLYLQGSNLPNEIRCFITD